jgi:hypothetical protein
MKRDSAAAEHRGPGIASNHRLRKDTLSRISVELAADELAGRNSAVGTAVVDDF